MPTPSDAEFWQSHYDAGSMGWDLGAAAPAWADLTKLHGVTSGRVLVLGAGRGHDALWFAKQGFSVLAVDFAASAVLETRLAAERAGLQVETRQEDIFRLTPELVGQFDVVVEHTCFCAIEPPRRAEYANIVTRLVKPGGWFLGVFFWEVPPGGPPFATSREQLVELFAPHFEVARLESNPVSVERRVGREGWGAFRRTSY